MNTDHADANLLYAQVYGHLWAATAARLVALDTEGMDMDVTVSDGTQRLRIAFDHRLHDVADAQRTLVAMAQHAQAVLTHTVRPRSALP
jgi:putative heme iron utilization protein